MRGLSCTLKRRLSAALIFSMVLQGVVFVAPEQANASGDGTLSSTVEINDLTTNGATLTNGDRYGAAVADIGDLDNDGVHDLLVGAPLDDALTSQRGAVHIHFMNANGTIKSTSEINGTTANGPVNGIIYGAASYGMSVAGIGDLDGDTVEDIAVGAYLDTLSPSVGAVAITFMNTNGTPKSSVRLGHTTTNGPSGLSTNDWFGRSIANIGDLNNDGVIDLLVGAAGKDGAGSDRGAAFILFMNANGSLISTVEIGGSTPNGATLIDGDLYGTAVAGLGDLNADGVEDIAVSAIGDDTGGSLRGAVYIHYMNTDGSIDSTVKIASGSANGATLVDSDRYGAGVANIGDLNGDGVIDLLVGSVSEAAFISFMNTDGSIDSTVEINGSTANGPTVTVGDSYGFAVAGISDFDGNGALDILVGAYFDDAGGTDRGAVNIHFMNQTAVPTNDPTLNNAITMSRLKQGVSSTFNLSFELQNAITGTLTVTFPVGFTVTSAATSGTCTGGTMGTFGFTSSTLTAVKTGCTAGALTLTGATVTNPGTPGTYTISWTNDDPGEGVVYIIDDDQVTVTGNVDPTLTFNVGVQDDATACDGTFTGAGGTLALGVLTTGAVTSSDASSVDHICTRVSTNATAGAMVTVRNANGASGLVSTSVPTDTIPSSTATLSAGTAGYGLCTGSAGGDSGNDVISGAASPTRSSPFNTTCTNAAHGVGGLTTTPQNLWTLASPSQNAFVRTYVKAAISPVTAAHADYTDTLTFIGTGTL